MKDLLIQIRAELLELWEDDEIRGLVLGFGFALVLAGVTA